MSIRQITFLKDFLPFRKDDEIYFKGEEDIQKLIYYFLKGKGIKDVQNNSKRFKINCILGNNGGGKTRLFNCIFDNNDLENQSKEIIRFNKDFKDNNGNKNKLCILLDDFFVLSGNIKDSLNYDILKQGKYNRFYCNIFNRSKDEKIIYSSFLNLSKKFDTNISISFKNLKENYKGDYFDFIYDEFDKTDKKSIKDEIEYNKILNFFEQLKKTYSDQDSELKVLGIDKSIAKNIWLGLSELFLTMVNHYYSEIIFDDRFIKDYFLSDSNSEKFKSDQKYINYKKTLELLKVYLDINFNLLPNKKLKYTLRENQNQEEAKKILENVKYNLEQLLKNIHHIEKENSNTFNAEQKISFRDIDGTEVVYSQIIEKIFGSKQTSQSEYLIINLMFGFCDTKVYSDKYIEENEQNKEILKKIKENKDKINLFRNYVYDGAIETGLKSLNKIFKYSGKNELSENLIDFIDNQFVDCDLVFKDGNIEKSFNNLSAGEKTILTRFTNIYMKILYQFKNGTKNFIILIDEPDLHLHLDWQKQYIQKLIDVFSTLDIQINLHFIIATHSPFILSDLPSESIILLENGTIKKYKNQTFGANYIDLIKDGFFFENKNLMGNFAETIIGNLSDEERNLYQNNENNQEEKENINKIKENIGDDFLRDNLLYFRKKNNDKDNNG